MRFVLLLDELVVPLHPVLFLDTPCEREVTYIDHSGVHRCLRLVGGHFCFARFLLLAGVNGEGRFRLYRQA